MRKSELDLTNLKNSLKTLSECYQDYVNQSDIKMKSYIKDYTKFLKLLLIREPPKVKVLGLSG